MVRGWRCKAKLKETRAMGELDLAHSNDIISTPCGFMSYML